MNNTFTIKETNEAKGVACMLLLLHHLFYSESKWGMFYSIGGINPPLIAIAANVGKVCVAMFIFLSGYGLAKSAEKSGESGIKFVYRHMVKLMCKYWFVFIIFVPLGFVFGRSPIDVYGNNGKGILRFIIDFLGLSNLAGTATMNATWWYMGAIICLYIMFPILYKGIKNMSILTLITLIITAGLCFFSDGTRWKHALLLWIFPFTVGIYISVIGLFDKIMDKKKLCIICSIVCIGISLLLRYKIGVKADTFLGIGIIIFTVSIFSYSKWIENGLELIGRHAANIFMMHTFIYAYYSQGIIYKLWYPSLIYIVLLSVCLVISIGLEKFKELIKYEKLQRFLLKIAED